MNNVFHTIEKKKNVEIHIDRKKEECRNPYRSIKFDIRDILLHNNMPECAYLRQTMYINDLLINTYLYFRLKAVIILMIYYCNMAHVFTYEDRCTLYVCICA